MVRAGLNPTLKLNGIEMVNALSDRYEEDIDIVQAAAEFGLTKDQLVKASEDVGKSLKPLVRRLEQDVVPRDQFETSFRDLATQVTDEQLIQLAANAKAAAANAKVAAAVAKPDKAEAKTDLALTSNLDGYKVGDSPVFTIISARDCFLTLTDVDNKGAGTVLFPNKFEQNNFIRAHVRVTFPGANAPYQYRMKDPGVVETVVATCSEHKRGVDGIKHDFKRSAFTSVSDYTRSIARSIAVEAVSRPTKPANAPREISRAAIKIQVR